MEAAIPRDVSGVFSLPAGTAAVPGEDIESADVNARFDALVSDANTARPISVGGTGGTSQATAQAALGVAAKQTSTSDTTVGSGLIVGGFGIGGVGLSVPNNNCNDAIGYTAVFQTVSGTTTNVPPPLVSGTLLNLERGGARSTQFWGRNDNNGQWIRQRTGSTTWTDWQQLVTVRAYDETDDNGYVRYSDGRQRAWITVSVSAAIATAFQGGYRTATTTASFSAPFEEPPTVTVSIVNLTAHGAILNAVSETSVGVCAVGPATQSSATRTFHIVAEGRWF